MNGGTPKMERAASQRGADVESRVLAGCVKYERPIRPPSGDALVF